MRFEKIRIINGASRVMSGAKDYISFDEFEQILNKVLEEESEIGYRLESINRLNDDVFALIFRMIQGRS